MARTGLQDARTSARLARRGASSGLDAGRKSAGHKRNLAMLATHPALVIAFTTIAGGTPGTRHTLTNAYRRGIRVVIVTPDGAIAEHTAPRRKDTSLGPSCRTSMRRPPATRRARP